MVEDFGRMMGFQPHHHRSRVVLHIRWPQDGDELALSMEQLMSPGIRCCPKYFIYTDDV